LQNQDTGPRLRQHLHLLDNQTARVAAAERLSMWFNKSGRRLVATAPERIVWKLYLGLLGRPPDPDGFQHYVERLRSGHTLEDIFEGFLSSPEYRERARRQLDEFWYPESIPASRGSGDTGAGLGETLQFSRERLVTTTPKELGRIAVVAPYPPAPPSICKGC